MEIVFVRDVEGVVPDNAMTKAGQFLAEAGYAPLPGGTCPTWQRGGNLGTLFAMTMDRLRTEVSIEAKPGASGSRLTLRYQVYDFGQFITKTNRRFWDVEAGEVGDHVAGKDPNLDRRRAYVEDARRDSRRFVLVSTVLAAALSALIVGLAWSLFAPPA